MYSYSVYSKSHYIYNALQPIVLKKLILNLRTIRIQVHIHSNTKILTILDLHNLPYYTFILLKICTSILLVLRSRIKNHQDLPLLDLSSRCSSGFDVNILSEWPPGPLNADNPRRLAVPGGGAMPGWGIIGIGGAWAACGNCWACICCCKKKIKIKVGTYIAHAGGII